MPEPDGPTDRAAASEELLATSNGVPVVLKSPPGATAYSLLESTLEPGGPMPMAHVHRSHEEAFYVVTGTLTLRLGDETRSAPPGTFALIPRGVPHSYANAGSEMARFLVISSPPGLERLFADFAGARAAEGRALSAEEIQRIGLAHDTDYLAPSTRD